MSSQVSQSTTKQIPNAGIVTRGERIFLLCLVVLSLGLRIAYHYEMQGNPLVENLQLDEQYHDQWARSIASGNIVGEGIFFRAPLYPYLLGISYAVFGTSPEIPRLVQHVLGSALIVLIYFLARMVFGRVAAVVASLLAALYSVLIYFEGRLLFDLPLTVLVLLWFTLVTYYADRPSWVHYSLLGFLFGLICTMRPTFLALTPFLFGYMVWKHLRAHPEIFRCAASLVIACALPILIVTARNVLVGGDFVVLASQGGINFYIGNNPQSDGMSSWIPEIGEVWGENREVEYVVAKAVGHPPSASEVSDYWYRKGLEFVFNNPTQFAQLSLKKLAFFWSHIEIANNLSYYWFERESFLLRFLPIGFWVVGPLGLAGALLSWKNPRARILLIFLFLYCLVTILFFVADRFRLPAIPILCIFAGYAIHRVIASIQTRDARMFMSVAAIIGAGAFIVNVDFTGLQPDKTLGGDGVKGHAALLAGDLEKAVTLLGRAAAVGPHNSSVQINLGIALWGLGRTKESAEAFHAAYRGNPHLASLNLAHLYFSMQQMDSASVYAQHAIMSRPFAPGGYVIAAKISLVKRDSRQAAEILGAGAEACRDNFMYGDYLLAGIHLQDGDIAGAESIYRRVLAQTEQSRHQEYALGSEKEQFGEDLPTLRGKSLQGLGRVFAVHGQLDSSETYFRAAATLLPMKGDVWGDWGVCLLRMNRLNQADTVMQRAVRLNANNPAVWLNYGTLLARKGDFDRAKAAVSQALVLNPDFEEAQRLMRVLVQSTPRRN